MRVLVVEDDEVFGLLVERLIEPYLDEGDEVTIVKSMAEADKYKEEHGVPDLTTLDLNLPDSRWPNTLNRIEDFRGERGVVMVISGVNEDLEGVSKEKGALAYLRKPFKEQGFLENMRDALKSLVAAPERYKVYSRIHQAISDHLETAVK